MPAAIVPRLFLARLYHFLTFWLLLSSNLAKAIKLDIQSGQSAKDAAGTAAYGLMKYYNANVTGVGIPGNLPDPYYWWEAGALMMSMVDYWYYTGDSTYNSQIIEGILHQTGPNRDFMTPNQTKTEGNDDQAFWAFAAMDAAELGFPDPPPDKPQWLALVQAVLNLQTTRWDTTTCGGGLRWQIFPFNAGYHYKNTISNGCYFSMAARLARYTGNDTYQDFAHLAWNWTTSVGLLDSNSYVFDGCDALLNCTSVNHLQFSYLVGVYLHGAANMWNVTEDPIWRERVDGLVSGLKIFFPDNNNIMVEVACEGVGSCNNDQRSFKAYLSRWMAATTQLAPWTHDTIMKYLSTSAQAAAQQCSGGADGNQCGLQWTQRSTFDGKTGVGEQMAAMQVIAATLIDTRPAPLTANTGGTSKGDPSAGTSGDSNAGIPRPKAITTADRAGAGIITILILSSIVGGAWFIVA